MEHIHAHHLHQGLQHTLQLLPSSQQAEDHPSQRVAPSFLLTPPYAALPTPPEAVLCLEPWDTIAFACCTLLVICTHADDLVDTNVWRGESDRASHILYELFGAVRLFMQPAAAVLQDQAVGWQALKQRPRPAPQTMLFPSRHSNDTCYAKGQQAYTPEEADRTVQVCPALLSAVGTQLLSPLFGLSQLVSGGLHIQVERRNSVVIDSCRHASHDGSSHS